MAGALEQYSANLGMVQISTANGSRNGTGPMGTLITGASNGTLIKSLTIKAEGDTSQGMIRFFIDDGGGTVTLYDEVYVPAHTASSLVGTFGITRYSGMTLKSGYILKVATEQAEVFNIFADGSDWTNCSCT